MAPPAAAGLPDLTRVEATLRDLFIATDGARLRDEDRKKARELVPLLAEVARALGQSGRPRLVVDAASGKSYVGLLAAALLPAGAGLRVVAIEREPRHAQAARDAAARLGLGGRFELSLGDVGDPAAWPEAPDLVAALHACGPASDAIIARAAAARARRLLLVPCCLSEAVEAMSRARAAAARLAVPDHAEVRRRFYQSMVDAERTLRLEAAGFAVEVVAFVPPTVTPHNLLWRARRVQEPERLRRAQADLARFLAVGSS